MSDTSQIYLGMPNAVLWCVDRYGHSISGRLYDSFHKEAVIVENDIDLLRNMEKLFDSLNFPFPGNNERHFVKRRNKAVSKENEKVMQDEELLSQRGDLGTFIIRVQHRQHSSWQGRITWVEENRTLYFRSALEMIKLIEEAMESSKTEETVTDSPEW